MCRPRTPPGGSPCATPSPRAHPAPDAVGADRRRRSEVDGGDLHETTDSTRAAPEEGRGQGHPAVRPEEGTIQSRARAIEAVLGLLTDQPVIICNGFPSREAFKLADRPTHFYMIGSMGVAPAIGLGVALAKPNKKVIVLDGDGNVLMSMGTLATVGALKPKNFLHVVLDN